MQTNNINWANDHAAIEELRNTTQGNFIIFLDGKPLETKKSGSINSKGSLVLTAYNTEIGMIVHRSNGNHGKKGFSIDDNDKMCPLELRPRLTYKH